MKTLFIIFICTVIGLSSSCVSPINCRKPFNLYKKPIIKSIVNNQAIYNGIFVSLNGEGALYLYENGLSKTISSSVYRNQMFWLNPKVEVVKLLEDDDYFKKEVWGHYQIFKDTIIIQTFGLANNQLCRRSIYETEGVILNDSTIKVFSDYSYWFDTEFIEEPNIYRLYKTEHKPDSTLAWFNKKRWYKKHLHESRRIK